MSELPPLSHHGETVKPYSDCSASAGTTGLLPLPSSGPSEPGPASLSRATTAATRRSVPCTFETAAAPIEWPMIAIRVVRPGVAVSPVGGAVEEPPVGVERRRPSAPAAFGFSVRRVGGGGEEVERVLGADHEVGQLLRRHPGAARLLAVLRLGERVAERQRVLVDRRVLVRERLAGALALHVVGEDDVAALGEVLGQPLVHPLGALHRPLGQHHAGEGAAQGAPGVGVRAPGRGPVDVPRRRAPYRLVNATSLDPAAGLLPAGAQRVADVPAREDVAGRDRGPGRASRPA